MEIYVLSYNSNVFVTMKGVELQAMRVFVHPPQFTSSSDITTTKEEEVVTQWLQAYLNADKTWASNTELAWNISPTLAVYLPSR